VRQKRWIKRWKRDSFLSRNGTILPYDKMEHLLLAFLGMLVSLLLWQARVSVQKFVFLWLVWNILGILWEYFQWQARRYPAEPKDVAANNLGFALAGLTYYLLF
jgi:VanZ family protein